MLAPPTPAALLGAFDMNDFLSKVRAGRTVLKKTGGPAHLPSPVLYVEWLSGDNKRRVKDADGLAHDLSDKIVQSHYRTITKVQAKALLEAHWPDVLEATSPS